MGQEDLYQSDFYENKNRFADVFNGALFGGKEIMKPEELENEDSVRVILRGKNKSKKVIADKIRKWQGGYVSIMVLENQSYVDYSMVLRVMEAEIIGYEKQRREAYAVNRTNNTKFDKHEYLSRMKKEQKFVPIITLVLYVGKNKIWDGERNLHGMLEMDEKVKPFVNDFKLNLFDYHDYDSFEMFKTENRLLFEMLSCGKDKKRMYEMLKKNILYKKMDKLTAEAIFEVLNVNVDMEKIIEIDETGREVYDMCKAFEDYKEEGRQEGRREGRQEGRKEVEIEIVDMIKNLMKNQEISFDTAT